MKHTFLLLTGLLFLLTSCRQPGTGKETNSPEVLQPGQVSALLTPALNCIQKPYPYKPGGVLGNDEALKTPREDHPAFYGCFDWHSSVHGHWTLVKLLKTYPGIPEEEEIREKLAENLSTENLQQETAYFLTEGNSTFERTYGWAWFLQLELELLTWDDPLGKELSAHLKPLADTLVGKYKAFLKVLPYPIRVGEHTNTAFGLTFAWDYAVAMQETELTELIRGKALEFYGNDRNCPLSWEPSGFDFLSPCLIEADLMSRVMDREAYRRWIKKFIPGLLQPGFQLEPAILTDRSDPKIVHLDGLNLSRAWCLYHISARLSDERGQLDQLADRHLEASLPYIASGNYEGEHWLASFAVYALFSRR
ncbi:MAG: DUF2891 domain-containing protein [Bacteroidota bacterium]